jgi:hypothetical protein
MITGGAPLTSQLPERLSAGERSLAGTTAGAERGAGHAMRSPRPKKRTFHEIRRRDISCGIAITPPTAGRTRRRQCMSRKCSQRRADLLERVRRTVHRIRATRVSRSRHRVQRHWAPAADEAPLRLLRTITHSLVAEQGRADPSPDRRAASGHAIEPPPLCVYPSRSRSGQISCSRERSDHVLSTR